MRSLSLSLLLVGRFAFGQMPSATPSYRSETVAGNIPSQEAIPAAEALLYSPRALTVRSDGSLYVSASLGIKVIQIDGLMYGLAPGIPPLGSIAVDSKGTLYSVGGPELYRRMPTGETSTFSPLERMPSSRGSTLTAVTIDRDGTPVIADSANSVVARVDPEGRAHVIAGLGSRVPLSVRPTRLAIDKDGFTYIASTNQIFKLATDGTLSLVAGNGQYGEPTIGIPAAQSPFNQRIGAIACADNGKVFVVDNYAHSVLAINAQGVIEAKVWSGNATDIAVGPNGELLVLDAAGIVVRVENDRPPTVLAGRLPFGGDGGPAITAILNRPNAVIVTPDGGLLIADTGNNRIRRVSPAGTIDTVAGTGVAGTSGDGELGIHAEVSGPTVLVADGQGNVYFGAQGYQQVRRLRRDCIVETIAGTGGYGASGDGGPAKDATFRSIDGLAVDGSGSLYISDRLSHTVRVVKDGIIFRYAGTGDRGRSGDGAAALDSALDAPTHLVIDAAGDLLIFEGPAFRFRKVKSASGEMSTVGTLPLGVPADDTAKYLCGFFSVSGVAADLAGNLFVAGDSHVCRYDKAGIAWAIAGSRSSGFSGDGGIARDALFGLQIGLGIDYSGSLLIADSANHRIRKLTPIAEE